MSVNEALQQKIQASLAVRAPSLARGIYRARMVAYIETGVHDAHECTQLIFELVGLDGPVLRTLEERVLADPYSHYQQLRRSMGPSGGHLAECLGSPFLVEVFHAFGERGIVYAQLKGPLGYRITPGPRDTPEAATAAIVFFWHAATAQDWEALYIPGEYASGRSKNVIQQRIKDATNWPSHPLAGAVEP